MGVRPVPGLRATAVALAVMVVGLSFAAPAHAQPLAGGGFTRSAPVSAAAAMPGYTSLTPVRLLGTRTGVGASKGALGPGGSVALQVTGRGGVPTSGVGAVVLNLTGTEPARSTYLTVYPTGEARPLASNLNLAAGQTVPNLVIAKVGAGGSVTIVNDVGSTHVVADVAGWYATGSYYHPLTPTRILDTRSGVGSARAPVGPASTIDLKVGGMGGVPASGAVAVALNVTATDPTAPTYVTAYPSGTSRPLASNLNLPPGGTAAAVVQVKLGTGGQVSLFNAQGSLELIADVTGWFAASGEYVPLSPARILDTRVGTGAPSRALPAGGDLTLPVAGVGGVPASGVRAVVVNVTVTEPAAAGFLTVFPSGVDLPLASNLNFLPGQTIANLVVVKVGTGDQVVIHNGSSGTVHVVGDVSGYYQASASWGAPVVVASPQGGLVSVSCPSPSFCAAVDAGGNAFTYDGTTWTGPTKINKTALVAVSCPTVNWCVAIDPTAALRFDGKGWSAPIPLAGAQYLSALSCPGAGFCQAVDSGTTISATFDGTTWGTPTALGTTAHTAVSMSCASISFCLALDTAGGSATFDGTRWTPTTTRGIVAAGLSPPGLSCSPSTFCMAVGTYRTAAF
ncbi:MAG TPA: hypothetical protein VFP72_06690, partial [Kineosporiaceae bacterium]|nr:hypothetical protein [Kineosporiaceae bacterium]